MTFNIVIANPPYNRTDIQMDFAIMAHKICTDVNCLLIPAKWQCKGDKTKDKIYETFRSLVVPHMKSICFFPNSVDVFEIGDPGGITFYIAVKNKEYTEKNIENRCNYNKYCNSKTTRTFIDNQNSLNNAGQTIIDKVKARTTSRYFVSEHIDRNKLQYWIGEVPHIAGGSGVKTGSVLFNINTGKLQVIAPGEVYSPYQIERGLQHTHYNVLFSGKDEDEIKSFISYAHSKLVRYLIFNSIAGMSSTGNDVWWRFVPEPYNFDHIFTDTELYLEYDLTAEEINIVESTIESRDINDIIAYAFKGTQY